MGPPANCAIHANTASIEADAIEPAKSNLFDTSSWGEFCDVTLTLKQGHQALQRWRTEQKGKGPPSTPIGRSFFYEINEVQEWMDRKKAGDVGGRILADDPAFGITRSS